MEQPESPPQPFPARSPEFPRDHFREDRFSRMYNDVSTINNGASSANADDPKSCFIASTTFSFFGNYFVYCAIVFHGWVVEFYDVRFLGAFE